MKKVLLILLAIAGTIYAADRIYKMYSLHFVNANESIVLINDRIADYETDVFFGLAEGTFDPALHTIVYSLEKKDGWSLDAYINLPVKRMDLLSGGGPYRCDVPYEEVRHDRFYDYEVGNINIIARLLTKGANTGRRLHDGTQIAKKYLAASYAYGAINVLEVTMDGVKNPCKN